VWSVSDELYRRLLAEKTVAMNEEGLSERG
jgi:hypothetical protein